MRLFLLPMPFALSEDQARTLCLAADKAKTARYLRRPDDAGAQLSLASQVLLRIAAARTLGVSARQITVAYTENGKPYLPGTHLHCSVSHTQGLCVCALADSPIGVDAERIRPAPMRVASRVFTPDEQAALRESRDPDRDFFRFWTRHESCVKLLGTGLRDIALPIPPDVRTQTAVWNGQFALSVCMFTKTS